MENPTTTLTIARRFRGPPHSGNGGYCCGLLAALVDGPAEITLKAPPPLDVPLDVVRDVDGARLMEGAREIASVRRATPQIAIPNVPPIEQAREAVARYAGFQSHLCPGCFVCGPVRTPEDGLNVFPGPLEGSAMVAAAWTPDKTFAAEDGHIAPEYLWAALDCPGYFALARPGLVAVLGRMVGEVRKRPALGEECIVCAWPVSHDGRKSIAGSAIFDAAGNLCAAASAIWVELKPDDQTKIYELERAEP